MPSYHQHHFPSRSQRVAHQALQILERFLHIEAMSGVVLLIAAASALIWSNSAFHASYAAFWKTSLSITFGSFTLAGDLHFWVNDVLMTLFFLVAGMEIRREIYEGALSSLKQAVFPVIAALGGVFLPALVYLLLNTTPPQSHGWAIPTATDIAFAVGILALLGKTIPGNIRIVLLSLAVIDDVIAVIIIALFYSTGLDPAGFAVAFLAIFLILLLQWLGLGSAWFYIFPAIILWIGFLQAGAHPSLTGVILGLLTPVLPARSTVFPTDGLMKATEIIRSQKNSGTKNMQIMVKASQDIRRRGRDIIAPVTRVQMALHPWVAFAIMPLFAFSNAGVRFENISFSDDGSFFVMAGVGLALAAGKPLGILSAGFLAVKSGFCRLPPDVSWSGTVLIGMLAGIGFTMSMFVAMLAFDNNEYLPLAKTGVLSGSAVSAAMGLGYGFLYSRYSKSRNR